MPIVLKSADDARRHLTEASKEIADRLNDLNSSLGANNGKLGEVLGIIGKGFDDIHTQCHSSWAAMSKLGESSVTAFSQIQETQKVLELQQNDLANIAKTAEANEAMAIEAKSDATTALRTANGNLSQLQETQLTASQYCLIFKGVPLCLEAGRENYRGMMRAFDQVLEELNLQGDILPKSLRRMTKRGDDMSMRPPHLRVELASINHRIMIFDQLREIKANGTPTFTVAPDIPRYALKRHNTLHKIAHIAREKNGALVTRVSMGQKWPALQIRNSKDEWVNMPDKMFESAKSVYTERQKEAAEQKKAAKRQGQPQSMDVDNAAGGSRQSSKNPRLPSKSTPAATRAKPKQKK